VIHVTNAAPVASDDHFSTRGNRALTLSAPGLLVNDRDADGDALRVSATNTAGLQGSLSSAPDGGFTFTPRLGFVGTTKFSYTVSDGNGGTATAVASIDVVNDAPDANADEYFVHSGRVLTVTAPGLLANDKDSDGDSLSVSVLNVTGLSGKGVISNPRADGSFTFTPNAGFAGDATFTYAINDGFGGSSTANAVIHVTNAAPVASDDHFSTRGNRALTLSAPGLLANDSDTDGDALRVSATNTAGLQGSLSSTPEGGFTFTPRSGFVGTTSFSYTVSDGNGGASTAVASIDVVNDAPDANADEYFVHSGRVLTVTAPGLLANDKDSDGDSLSVSVLNVTGLSGKGVISPRADGSFTFTPNAGFVGDATFTYTINDGFGGNATATALVHVGNAAPVAVEDSYSVHVGRTLAVAAPGLLANDSDANGDPLQVTSLNVTGLQGTLSPFADGHFSFIPTSRLYRHDQLHLHDQRWFRRHLDGKGQCRRLQQPANRQQRHLQHPPESGVERHRPRPAGQRQRPRRRSADRRRPGPRRPAWQHHPICRRPLQFHADGGFCRYHQLQVHRQRWRRRYGNRHDHDQRRQCDASRRQ
jgi:hypothetical protein